MSSALPPRAGQPAAPLRIRLYIAGASPNSTTAVAALRALMAEFPLLRVELDIIDVLKEPARGLSDGVFVTPMLVKLEPFPERRVLGNLRDRKVLLGALGLDEVRGA